MLKKQSTTSYLKDMWDLNGRSYYEYLRTFFVYMEFSSLFFLMTKLKIFSQKESNVYVRKYVERQTG